MLNFRRVKVYYLYRYYIYFYILSSLYCIYYSHLDSIYNLYLLLLIVFVSYHISMYSNLEQKIYVSCYDGYSILYHYRILYSMNTLSLLVCLFCITLYYMYLLIVIIIEYMDIYLYVYI